ncbi:hypothetical protein BC629DRAFT_1440137 [Irpex lacteus]|nr:hypothetical protein BC629DRAFT_1443533 [Irpex lacteus]KAI0788937.1 hypothetical protein BC629DRAFT_1440137 [Irpex lacteus]
MSVRGFYDCINVHYCVRDVLLLPLVPKNVPKIGLYAHPLGSKTRPEPSQNAPKRNSSKNTIIFTLPSPIGLLTLRSMDEACHATGEIPAGSCYVAGSKCQIYVRFGCFAHFPTFLS